MRSSFSETRSATRGKTIPASEWPTRTTRSVALIEIDISTDFALERRYGQDIPVLLIDGAEVARHRIGEHDLRLMLGRAQE